MSVEKIDKFDGDYFFLSNFYPSEVSYRGMYYPTVEHAYQCAKAVNKQDRLFIANSETPGMAKRRGNQVPMRKDWEDVKEKIMFKLLCQKFRRPDLKRALSKTTKKWLIEGNYWHDKYWGVCYCQSCHGRGDNILGKLLMKVRKKIIAGEI